MYDTKTIDAVYTIIQNSTKVIMKDNNKNFKSNLTFRRLNKIIQGEKRKSAYLLFLGRDRLKNIICDVLVPKGLVEVRIDGNVIKDFDDVKENAPGKKWEIVALEKSDSFKHQLRSAKTRIVQFENKLKELNAKSLKGKFSASDFFDFAEIRNEIFSYPLKIYSKSTKIVEVGMPNFFENVINSIMKNCVVYLQQIEERQRRFYPDFNDIVNLIINRNMWNAELNFGLWESQRFTPTRKKQVEFYLQLNMTQIMQKLGTARAVVQRN